VVNYLYDPALGLLTSETHLIDLTSGATVTSSFQYDAWGRKTAQIGPDATGQVWKYYLCSATSGANTDPVVDNVVVPSCPQLATYAIVGIPEHFASGQPPYQNGPKSIAYYDGGHDKSSS